MNKILSGIGECSGSFGRALDKGSEVSCSRLNGVTVLCPLAILVLVQPRKTENRSDMTEKLLTGM